MRFEDDKKNNKPNVKDENKTENPLIALSKQIELRN